MLFYEKYTPYTLNGIVGNEKAIWRLREFGMQVQKGVPAKPLLIYGPTGTGKTTAAHALAYSYGFELLELNASDYRDAQTLSKELMPASISRGIFAKKLLILLDEIDNLSTKYDAGAEQVITKLIKTSKHPIIFIANDMWSKKIAFLRDKVETLEFKKVSMEEIFNLMKKIVKSEKKELDESILREIAERSNGDIRGALNDLELMLDANPKLIENLGIRNRKLEIFSVLDQVFTSRNFETARRAAIDADVDSNMLIKWIAENIPIRYAEKREMYGALYTLAEAGFYMEKAERTGYYDYLKYASTLMSGGVAVANTGAVSMLRHYTFPTTIKYLSKTKRERDIKGEIVSKLIYKLHAGKRDIIDSYMPLLKTIAEIDKREEGLDAVIEFFEKNYSLEKDEVEYLINEV